MGGGESSPTGKPNQTGDKGSAQQEPGQQPPSNKPSDFGPDGKSGSHPMGDQPSDKNQNPNTPSSGPNNGGAGGGDGQDLGNKSTDTPPDAPGKSDPVNEEYTRKTTELVIRKLKDDLKRGKVDQKLLDELGWDTDRLKKFVEQMERALQDTGDDQSPTAVQRRRQFQTTIDNLKLPQAEGSRKGTSTRSTRAQEIGGRRVEPPPEYRDQYEAYTKSLKAQPNNKPAPTNK